MVMRALVEWEIREGDKLISALGKTTLKVSTAFWMYDPYAEDWRLHLTSRVLLRQDLSHMYALVGRTIKKAGLRLRLGQIKLVNPTRPEIKEVTKELSPAFKQDLKERGPIWYSSSSTSTQSPGDWLIYKST